MEKIFAEMFSRQPDEITGGDYYYRSPWLEDIYAEKAKSMGFASVDEFFEWRDGRKIFSFRHKWLQDRSNPFFCDPCMPHLLEKSETGNIDFKFEETIQKIADENKAFMDIASSENMGFAPYVVKMNPNIPCLVTDIDAHAMKYLRVCINKHLTGYNINIASFDNYGIPIKDNSLDCITSNYGISSSGGNPAARPKTNTPQLHAGSEKAIDEVYRVLKPGGCYVAIEIERECDFDLRRMYEYHGEHGSLFGLYTYDEIQAVCGLLTEEPWREKFISAGFEVEVEQKHIESCSLSNVMDFLYYITKYHGIRRWEKENWDEQRRAKDFVWSFDKEELKNIGMDFYDVDTFFVLRKPG